MVNNTVNGKKIGKPAGINDVTVFTATEVQEKGKELVAKGKVDRTVILGIMHAGEFVSIKAYPGGNPNKEKSNREEEDLTH